MAEYIKKEDIEQKIQDGLNNMALGHDAIEVLGMIYVMSAADVAPVQHGWWNDGDPYCPICRKDKFRGLDADVWADWKPDYCPNCGAKMDAQNIMMKRTKT